MSLLITLRYKKIFLFSIVLFALVTELIIVFGVAALLKVTIDLATIGGLIAAIGTGVDDQIIITDEYFRKDKKYLRSKSKIKNAFFVVLVAYCTTFFAMVPLIFGGLKILQGFAFMILIGITVGVLITRPAFSELLRIFTTTKEEREAEKINNE